MSHHHPDGIAPAGQRARVLFVLKQRDQPYGQDYSWGEAPTGRPMSSGLCNSAGFVVEMLAAAGVPAQLVHVRDGNDVHREVKAFRATHVIIEAFWCPPYKFDDLQRACPGVHFIVRNHSETPFLASEGMAFEWSLEYLKRPNVALAPNSPRMLADTRFLARMVYPGWSDAELERRVPFLPNVYPVERSPCSRKGSDGYLDVGCFGAIRPLKNLVTQAIGALIFADRVGRRLNFHINGQRVEMGGGPILKNLRAIFDHTPRASLMEHGWMDHAGFRSLVARMDVVSQVSFSETFNIVAADAASQHVPIAVSAEVPWASRLSQADPTDARSIAAAMERAWISNSLAEHNRVSLAQYSDHSRHLWLEFVR
jgi:hypothetical protein